MFLSVPYSSTKERAERKVGAFGCSGLVLISRCRQAESVTSRTLMRRCRQATMTMAVGVVISLMQAYLASSLYPDKAGNSIVKTAESNYLFLVILICIAKHLFAKALLYSL